MNYGTVCQDIAFDLDNEDLDLDLDAHVRRGVVSDGWSDSGLSVSGY